MAKILTLSSLNRTLSHEDSEEIKKGTNPGRLR
jgi:hypothetical protein